MSQDQSIFTDDEEGYVLRQPLDTQVTNMASITEDMKAQLLGTRIRLELWDEHKRVTGIVIGVLTTINQLETGQELILGPVATQGSLVESAQIPLSRVARLQQTLSQDLTLSDVTASETEYLPFIKTEQSSHSSADDLWNTRSNTPGPTRERRKSTRSNRSSRSVSRSRERRDSTRSTHSLGEHLGIANSDTANRLYPSLTIGSPITSSHNSSTEANRRPSIVANLPPATGPSPAKQKRTASANTAQPVELIRYVDTHDQELRTRYPLVDINGIKMVLAPLYHGRRWHVTDITRQTTFKYSGKDVQFSEYFSDEKAPIEYRTVNCPDTTGTVVPITVPLIRGTFLLTSDDGSDLPDRDGLKWQWGVYVDNTLLPHNIQRSYHAQETLLRTVMEVELPYILEKPVPRKVTVRCLTWIQRGPQGNIDEYPVVEYNQARYVLAPVHPNSIDDSDTLVQTFVIPHNGSISQFQEYRQDVGDQPTIQELEFTLPCGTKIKTAVAVLTGVYETADPKDRKDLMGDDMVMGPSTPAPDSQTSQHQSQSFTITPLTDSPTAFHEWVLEVTTELKRERDQAIHLGTLPDYHAAIQAAFLTIGFSINDEKLQLIRLGKSQKLTNKDVLRDIWTQMTAEPTASNSLADLADLAPITSSLKDEERSTAQRTETIALTKQTKTGPQTINLQQSKFTAFREPDVHYPSSNTSSNAFQPLNLEPSNSYYRFATQLDSQIIPAKQPRPAEWNPLPPTFVETPPHSSTDDEVADFEPATPLSSPTFLHTLIHHLPPGAYMQNKLQEAINGNYEHAFSLEVLYSIVPEDFLRYGRFAHIHVPRYEFVNSEILDSLHKGPIHKGSHLYFAVYMRTVYTRYQALLSLPADISLQGTRKGTKALLSRMAEGNFAWDAIDVIQHERAFDKVKQNKGLHAISLRQAYDWIFRPLERLVAIDMPLSNYLLQAAHSEKATDTFLSILCAFIGMPRIPARLPYKYIIEEMSKVRHWQSRHFFQTGDDTPPLQVMTKVELRQSPTTNYAYDIPKIEVGPQNHSPTFHLPMDSAAMTILRNTLRIHKDRLQDLKKVHSRDSDHHHTLDRLIHLESNSQARRPLQNKLQHLKRQLDLNSIEQSRQAHLISLDAQRITTRGIKDLFGDSLSQASIGHLQEYMIHLEDTRRLINVRKTNIEEEITDLLHKADTLFNRTEKKSLLSEQNALTAELRDISNSIKVAMNYRDTKLSDTHDWAEESQLQAETAHIAEESPRSSAGSSDWSAKSRQSHSSTERLPPPRKLQTGLPGSYQPMLQPLRGSNRQTLSRQPQQQRYPPSRQMSETSRSDSQLSQRSSAPQRSWPIDRVRKPRAPTPESRPNTTAELWNGKKVSEAPQWARTRHSAKTLAQEVNFLTATDQQLIQVKKFTHRLPLPSINRRLTCEIKLEEQQVDNRILIQNIGKGFTRAEGTFEQHLELDSAYTQALVDALHELSEHELSPMNMDNHRTDNTILTMTVLNHPVKLAIALQINQTEHGKERTVDILLTWPDNDQQTLSIPWIHLWTFTEHLTQIWKDIQARDQKLENREPPPSSQ